MRANSAKRVAQVCWIMNIHVLLVTATTAHATILYVTADRTGDFTTIQDAISAAENGDEIVLAEGTYFGEGNTNLTFNGKVITVRSADPTSTAVVRRTVIDCYGEGRAVYLNDTAETPATVIDGLTITHGTASGIYINQSSPTIRRCVISACSNTGSGGGIWARQSGAHIIDCQVIGNASGSASGVGGGIYLDRPRGALIARCVIADNVSLYHGGGMECSRSGDAEIRDCLIAYNTTTYHGGAGVYIWYNCSPVIANCIIAANSAGGTFADGGGLCIIGESHPTLRSCLIIDNHATENGGAIYATSPVTIQHCTIIGNSAGTSGGGIHGDGGAAVVMLTNSILWANTCPVAGGRQLALTGSDFWGFAAAQIAYSDVQGGEANVLVEDGATLDWGSGTITAGPLFTGSAGRLSSNSPCIDAGDSAWTPDGVETDLDGHGRVLCGVTDMGAYEFGIGDYNCDRSLDERDIPAWPGCLTGPAGGPYPSGCEALDFDADADVDLADFRAMQEAYGQGWK